MKISKPKKIFVVLFLLSLLLGAYVLKVYKKNTEIAMATDMHIVKIRVEHALDSIFFTTDLLESIVILGYDTMDKQTLEAFLEPIHSQPVVESVCFLPNGILKSIHPLKGNEKAIGDNIFTMPARKAEAQIALEIKDTIICGPYELTQGGMGLIARKAIFLHEDFKKDELWGFIAVVLDVDRIISNIDFKPTGLHGYGYELTASVNGLDKTVIVASDNFNAEKAIYADIHLPNGKWQLGLNTIFNVLEAASMLLLSISGILASIIVYLVLEKKEKQLALLEEKMYIDPLTNAFNRKKLDFFETQSMHLQQPYAIFYLDLDNFKQINDTYGHETGDNILIAFTQRAKKIIKESDLLIRVGGDEFVMILFDIESEAEVKKLEQRLRTHLSQKLTIHKIRFVISASIGCARYPAEGKTFNELFTLADSRMYEDKKNNVNKAK